MKYSQLVEELSFKNNHMGYSHGQHDYELIALNDDKLVGYISYSVYEDEVSVKMIEVSETSRGQKIGKNLILHLQSLYPDVGIDFGYTTEDGNNLLKSIKFKEIPVFNNKFYQKLKDTKAELQNRIKDKPYDTVSKLYDLIYILEDKIEEIENSKEFNNPIKRIAIG